ncbi:hypothetical protein BT69DRAFT_1297705 [Atractiella rhizophila]|nr:hypothetical protein BT69DRAFT_1297705 [Atractiella rhizophila]
MGPPTSHPLPLPKPPLPTPQPGVKYYFQNKIEDLKLEINRRTRDLRRLEATRNGLNAKVRLLREELQLLQEPGSYVGEVVKLMGKKKVLVKIQPEGKYAHRLNELDFLRLSLLPLLHGPIRKFGRFLPRALPAHFLLQNASVPPPPTLSNSEGALLSLKKKNEEERRRRRCNLATGARALLDSWLEGSGRRKRWGGGVWCILDRRKGVDTCMVCSDVDVEVGLPRRHFRDTVHRLNVTGRRDTPL